jgi:hypothetical protein
MQAAETLPPDDRLEPLPPDEVARLEAIVAAGTRESSVAKLELMAHGHIALPPAAPAPHSTFVENTAIGSPPDPAKHPNPRLRVVGGKADVPHSLIAEESLLTAMIQGGLEVSSELLELVAHDEFLDRKYRVLCHAIADLVAASQPFDAMILIESLVTSDRLETAGGADLVVTLSAASPVRRDVANRYARIVHEQAGRRLATEAASQIQQKATEGRLSGSNLSGFLREWADRLEEHKASEVESLATVWQGWPTAMRDEAFHGVAGEIVKAISPQTEADGNALLVQFLVAFGSVVGRNAHWVVNSTRHFTNLNANVIGPSGFGCKGTGMDIIEDFLGELDPEWLNHAIQTGLSSGEGLIWAIRDASVMGAVADPGVEEKRALLIETEFSKVIAKMGADKSILMEVICQAWDGKPLRNNTKTLSAKCRDPHVSIIGHSTIKVIRAALNDTLKNSGFGNRFLWCCSLRSRELPFGGNIKEIYLDPQLMRLGDAVNHGSNPMFKSMPFEMDAAATSHFTTIYSRLTRPRAGDAAPLLDRAAPTVRRLALIFALLDCDKTIRLPHLKAALAVWDYCERSTEFLFGDPVGDPLKKKSLELVCKAGEKGMTRNELTVALTGGRDREKVASLLTELLASGLIAASFRQTGRKKTPVFVASTLSGGARFARFGRENSATPKEAKA